MGIFFTLPKFNMQSLLHCLLQCCDCRHDNLSDIIMYFSFQVQYEANLPNFVTSYSRDPLNLKLKSQNLNIGKSLTFTVLENLGISM